eukprot:TRINITY_DN6756_c0_g1_i7.p1 TRINITY_DN6756_c0_g1~~TRINITY_DN6756_c0_g1_i7.p1  ORF type:complete len:245 (+),score=21.98 TRINITY_DN6756_c0_g1_i7:65-799(+)
MCIRDRYSLTLAERGFNIVLIARNRAKLESVESEIKTQSPGVSTRIVVCDFENSPEPGFFERIDDQIKDLDISLLINNAGVGIENFFEKETQAGLRSLLNINVYPVALLTHLIVPRMLKRSKRSGIINVSSRLGTFPTGYLANYCGSKALADFFSRALAVELGEKIDVLSHVCGSLATKMTTFNHKSFFVLSPKEAVDGILRELGSESTSGGNWRHQLNIRILPYVNLTETIKKGLLANPENNS